MRRLILGAGLAALAAGPALAETRTFTVTSFDRIRMSGPFKVTLATGQGPSAHADGDPRTLDRVRAEVQDRTLILQLERGEAGSAEQASGPVTVALTTPSLTAAVLLGSGTLAVDSVKGGRVYLTLSGSGRLEVGALSADRLDLIVAGSGSATIAGAVAQMRLVSQASGAIDLARLTVQDADVTADGTGDVTLTATRAARGSADGSSNVKVLGDAACTIAAKGVGTVDCRNAPAR